MAMSEDALKNRLVTLFNLMRASPMSEEEYAESLAGIITAHVRTATVTVDPGIPVGTPAGAGATSGPGTGRLT